MNPALPRIDPLRARLARRACDLIDHFAQDHQQDLPELERLATALPLWLRRHGLVLTLKKIEGMPDKPEVRKLMLKVLKELDLSMSVDLAKCKSSQSALIACSAVALRHADVFCEVAKAMLYLGRPAETAASSISEGLQS